ncbi:MAG TPA: DUF4215 domain-containing protein [Nannocystaceae bacterium]|nr:DUF4215 domain-containing protein [Nannocystaceae bacterium]
MQRSAALGLGFALVLVACGDETTPATDESESSGSAETTGTPPSTDTSGNVDASSSADESSEAEASSSADESSEGATFECGNGVLDPGEVCDDGNDDETDECTTSCITPGCGDGIVQQAAFGETCDDGNHENFDECPSDCILAECGDGVREGTEGCDDGVENGNGITTCTTACAENVCGDGYLATLTEQCDDAAANGDGTSTCTNECRRNVCGDGYLHASSFEQCDDGDENGVTSLCSRRCTTTIVTNGIAHTCARLPAGNVRCWGFNQYGSLGYEHFENIGDDETPADAGDVDVGGNVLALAAGGLITCAIIEGNTLRCWGTASWGQLGYGIGDLSNSVTIGDDETPADMGDIDLGGPVLDVVVGSDHTCALMMDNTVRCWGYRATGTPGYGHQSADFQVIGDDESPSVPEALVDVGAPVVALRAAQDHTCAILDGGGLRCWGSSQNGRLGFGYDTGFVGDNETPAMLGDVPVGEPVLDVLTGANTTCVLLGSGNVRCVGQGMYGGLATGSTGDLGLADTIAEVDDVDLGMTAIRLAGHIDPNCAIGTSGELRCWGIRHGYDIPFGYIGDDETPEQAGDLGIDEPVVDVAAGNWSHCLVTYDGGVRCWGDSPRGELGYGNTNQQQVAALATDLELE